MPSIAAHFAFTKLILDDLNVDKEQFYKGNILPDIIDCKDSHFKIEGKHFLIPDIDFYIQSSDLSRDINKGYLSHLLLDKYFLEEFVPIFLANYDKRTLFSPNMMYNDYSNINMLLVEKYGIDVNYINHIMGNYEEKINMEKYLRNLKSINNTEKGEPRIIDFDAFCSFLEVKSKVAVKELKRW